MNRVIVDPATLAQLQGAQQTLDLCDKDGRVLGRFIPIIDRRESLNLEPQVSEGELDRRERVGGGRRLGDILKDLEKRS